MTEILTHSGIEDDIARETVPGRHRATRDMGREVLGAVEAANDRMPVVEDLGHEATGLTVEVKLPSTSYKDVANMARSLFDRYPALEQEGAGFYLQNPHPMDAAEITDMLAKFQSLAEAMENLFIAKAAYDESSIGDTTALDVVDDAPIYRELRLVRANPQGSEYGLSSEIDKSIVMFMSDEKIDFDFSDPPIAKALTHHRGETDELISVAKELYKDDPARLQRAITNVEHFREQEYPNVHTMIGMLNSVDLRRAKRGKDRLLESPDLRYLFKEVGLTDPQDQAMVFEKMLSYAPDPNFEGSMTYNNLQRLVLTPEYAEVFGNREVRQILEVHFHIGVEDIARYDPGQLLRQVEMLKQGNITADTVVMTAQSDYNGALSRIGYSHAEENAVFFQVRSAEEVGDVFAGLQGKISADMIHFVLAAHGTHQGMELSKQGLSASMLRAGQSFMESGKTLPQLFPDKQIMVTLQSCSTGSGEDVGSDDETWSTGMAQSLANELGVPVEAPTSDTIGIEKLGNALTATVYRWPKSANGSSARAHSTDHGTLTVYPQQNAA